MFLFLVVAQVGLVLHSRDLLVAAASEGAHLGAQADRTPEEGAARAAAVATGALPGVVVAAEAVPAAPGLVDVEVTARLKVVLLPVAPVTLTVHGHAVQEGP